nr:TonB-dependent vitamin B12 receptor [Azomonas macrocytogenes]
MAAFALLGAPPFFTPVGQAAEDTLNLDEQIVTASRLEEKASKSLAAVTVIDREEIERSQAQSLTDVFKKVPGISLSNTGGPGKTTSLFMRGTNSNHVLVMIDGVKVGSITSGQTAYQDLPVELIERIEVVRGPRSTLYGSEAIGGVIQIFTRKGAQDGGLKPFFAAGYGTHDTYETSGGVSGGNGHGWFTLAFNAMDTDGIEAKDPGSSGYENDADGYRNLGGTLRAGYRFDNGLELDGTVMRTSAHNDYDSLYGKTGKNANADNKQNLVSGRIRFAPLDPWQTTLQFGRSEDKSDAYQDGKFYSRFDTRRDHISWQNDFTLAEGHTLTLGADHQRDEVNGSTNYREDSRTDDGAFLQYVGRFGRHDLQLAARHDDDEEFGSHKTGSAAWGYALTDSVRTFLSWGTAFKAPTFNQLYYPNFGNPDLKPEKSRTIEAGFNGQHDWGHWSLNLYRTRIIDLISTITVNGRSQSEGVDKARIRGLELTLGSELWGWAWNANYTAMDAENRSKRSSRGGIRYYGKDLNRRPSQMLNLDLDRSFGAFDIGATLHAQNHSYDDLENQTRLAGFATLDLRGEYHVSPGWRLQARVANLFNKDYETAAGYNQPGQAVYLTLRYQAL